MLPKMSTRLLFLFILAISHFSSYLPVNLAVNLPGYLSTTAGLGTIFHQSPTLLCKSRLAKKSQLSIITYIA